MAAFSPPQQSTSECSACVQHAKVNTPAMWALQTALVHCCRIPLLSLCLLNHRYLLFKSSCVYFFRRLTGMASPAVLIPHMLAAVAQPTRQSNQ